MSLREKMMRPENRVRVEHIARIMYEANKKDPNFQNFINAIVDCPVDDVADFLCKFSENHLPPIYEYDTEVEY